MEISVPGAFTAVGFSGQQKKPGASAAERGRPSLFKTIDEDRRQRHDHINRSDRSTYPGRISVLTSGATPFRLKLVAFAADPHRQKCTLSPEAHRGCDAHLIRRRASDQLRLKFPHVER